jgi:hypothetical protein
LPIVQPAHPTRGFNEEAPAGSEFVTILPHASAEPVCNPSPLCDVKLLYAFVLDGAGEGRDVGIERFVLVHGEAFAHRGQGGREQAPGLERLG